MFKKILACLDKSNLSEQVLEYAAEEALAFNAELILLHVIPEPYIVSPSLPGTSTLPVQNPVELGQLAKEEEKASAYLENIAGGLRERGIRVETLVLQGDAGNTIINYGQENDIDLIALATHGRGGLEKLFYGSVADSVLKRSGLPILLIRPRNQ